MKIVLVHNYYQQPGGEDQVFAAEGAMLEARGHNVLQYIAHNDVVDTMGKLALAKATIWNRDSYRELKELFRSERPDVVHVHNTLPLISPAVYYAAKEEGAAVVQTLHNYRVTCVNGLLFRDGKVCEDCLGKTVLWPGVRWGCYRDSPAASGVVAAMLAYHKLRRTYHEMVDMYIALTEFSRVKFIEAGLPADKIVIKPNFVDPDPGVGSGHGEYALFVGRLSREKGLETLVAAWEHLGKRLPLKLLGDGPLAPLMQEVAARSDGVEWLGRRSTAEVYELMGEAMMLVFPSEWYEGMPRTIIESFAKGTFVVASDMGAMSSMVEHGRTGFHFEPGNPEDLAIQVDRALSQPEERLRMRAEARAEYESKYTAERNYQMLIEIYRKVVEAR